MSCRSELKKNNKQNKKQENTNILIYYPHQIEKNNCLDKTELALGKTLRSCEIFLKGVFLAECVGCTNDVWIKVIIITVLSQLANASWIHIRVRQILGPDAWDKMKNLLGKCFNSRRTPPGRSIWLTSHFA